MKKAYLLDTHVLLWWLGEPERLSEPAREVIRKRSHALFVSAAAAWEIAIKSSLGRIAIPRNFEEMLEEESIDVLPVRLAHALAVADLPAHHQDPFDRMQIAQASVEGLVFITRDAQIRAYDIPVLDA